MIDWNYCAIKRIFEKKKIYIPVFRERMVIVQSNCTVLPSAQTKLFVSLKRRITKRDAEGTRTCSLMSCNCCCSFCMSLWEVSRLPLFIRRVSPATVLFEGVGSSSGSALTSDIVPSRSITINFLKQKFAKAIHSYSLQFIFLFAIYNNKCFTTSR